MIYDSISLHHMSKIYKLHPDTTGSPDRPGCRRILLVDQQDGDGVEVEERLLLEPRLDLLQLRHDAIRAAVDDGCEGTIGLLVRRRRICGDKLPQDPPRLLHGVNPDAGSKRAPEGISARPRILDLDAGDAEAEGGAGALAVPGDALVEVVVGRVRGPGAGADLEVDDGGGAEGGEEVIEGEVRARAGAVGGGEEVGAMEGRKEGADGGRYGGVGGEGGVEGELRVAATVSLEGLVEKATAVDQGTELAVLGAMAPNLVLRWLQHLASEFRLRRRV